MALYYLCPLINTGFPPEDMIDMNMAMDSSKLQLLVDLDKGIKREDRISALEEIIEKDYVDMHLKRSFPAKELTKRDNFLSLLYYFGMLTIGGGDSGTYHMIIPNDCVRQQLWRFKVGTYATQNSVDIDIDSFNYRDMIFEGKWKPVIEIIGQIFE